MMPRHSAGSKRERFGDPDPGLSTLSSAAAAKAGIPYGVGKNLPKKRQREEKSGRVIQTHPHRLVGAEEQFFCLAVIWPIVYIQLDLRVCSLRWLVLIKQSLGRKGAVDNSAN